MFTRLSKYEILLRYAISQQAKIVTFVTALWQSALVYHQIRSIRFEGFFFWDSKYYVSTHFWSAIFFSSCMIDHCPCNFFLHYLLLVLVVESWRTPYIKTVTIWLDVARLTLKRYPCELHSDPRYTYSTRYLYTEKIEMVNNYIFTYFILL